jgi:thioredoxin reductase (NADPH)
MSEKIVIYSTVWSPDCKRTNEIFADHRIEYQKIDIEQNIAGMAFVEQVNEGMQVILTVVFQDGTIFSEPTNAELAEKLGVQTEVNQTSYDVIIISADPSG